MFLAIKEDQLKELVSSPDPGFNDIYGRMSCPQKEKGLSFLYYFHKVLSQYDYETITAARTGFIHLHLPFLNDEENFMFLEYLVIRQFLEGVSNDLSQGNFISECINKLQRKLDNLQIPDNASGNRGNRKLKEWENGRKQIRDNLKFLRSDQFTGKEFTPRTILNLYAKDSLKLEPRVRSEWYSVQLNELLQSKKRSYVLLNSEFPSDELCEELNRCNFLNDVKEVILFDCDRRKLFGGYNKRYLEQLLDFGIEVKRLIVISVERLDLRVSRSIERCQLIYSNFYHWNKEDGFAKSYVFLREEKDVLNGIRSFGPNIEWFGDEREIFRDYVELVRDYDIDKLRAILYRPPINWTVIQR